MTKYMLRYTTLHGFQFVQEFDSKEDRDNAFNLIGSTKIIYGKESLVIVSDDIVSVEAVEERVYITL